MKNLEIQTALHGRAEIFKILALAEAIGLPVLLVGPPGVGKTQSMLEYAQAKHDGDWDEAVDKSFILETDEGTRTVEVKGRIDIKKLTVDHEFQMVTPIAKSEFVMINEIDKASSGLRNSLLGVMNEKIVFNGHEKIPCKWDIFCATCNEIPKDEAGNPFWDRFVIKYELTRADKKEIINFYSSGLGKNKNVMNINFPENEEDFANYPLSLKNLTVFVNHAHDKLTDRTLTKIPIMAKAVGMIWNLSQTQALVKTASLLIGAQEASALSKKLESPAISTIRSQIDMIWGFDTHEEIAKMEAEVAKKIEKLSEDKSTKDELRQDLDSVLQGNQNYEQKG